MKKDVIIINNIANYTTDSNNYKDDKDDPIIMIKIILIMTLIITLRHNMDIIKTIINLMIFTLEDNTGKSTTAITKSRTHLKYIKIKTKKSEK